MNDLPRPNWIEIHLDGLIANVRTIRELLPAGTRIFLPVKADAYGHGSLACSYAAQFAGVDWLGVAHLGEGVLLRQYGVHLPILVLGPAVPADFPFLVEHGLTPTIADEGIAKAFSQFLSGKAPHKAHIKVDTGMHRFGIPATDHETVARVLKLPNVVFEGLYSHLATADEPGSDWAEVQSDRFRDLVTDLTRRGVRPPLCHLGNSGAVLLKRDVFWDMVRPGIALYGLNPMGYQESPVHLVPVLRMRATVRQIHRVPAGEGVSYGKRWIADRDTLVATVSIGYGDGFPRGPGKPGHLFIRGLPCPILGTICMDATMVDVSHVPGVAVGDTVHVVDRDIDPSIALEAWAERHGTICYELACHVARRLYRRYWWNGKLVRWDDLKVALGVPDSVSATR